MKQFFQSFSWYLYGGVSCYCLQRFLMDFLYISKDEHDLFRSGDIVILDVWNRLELKRNNLICTKSPDDHHQIIFGRVIALENERINMESMNRRKKIPKGSIAMKLLNDQTEEQIKIVPMGLIEGRALARIWPFSRFTNRLLTIQSSET